MKDGSIVVQTPKKRSRKKSSGADDKEPVGSA